MAINFDWCWKASEWDGEKGTMKNEEAECIQISIIAQEWTTGCDFNCQFFEFHLRSDESSRSVTIFLLQKYFCPGTKFFTIQDIYCISGVLLPHNWPSADAPDCLKCAEENTTQYWREYVDRNSNENRTASRQKAEAIHKDGKVTISSIMCTLVSFQFHDFYCQCYTCQVNKLKL